MGLSAPTVGKGGGGRYFERYGERKKENEAYEGMFRVIANEGGGKKEGKYQTFVVVRKWYISEGGTSSERKRTVLNQRGLSF